MKLHMLSGFLGTGIVVCGYYLPPGRPAGPHAPCGGRERGQGATSFGLLRPGYSWYTEWACSRWSSLYS